MPNFLQSLLSKVTTKGQSKTVPATKKEIPYSKNTRSHADILGDIPSQLSKGERDYDHDVAYADYLKAEELERNKAREAMHYFMTHPIEVHELQRYDDNIHQDGTGMWVFRGVRHDTYAAAMAVKKTRVTLSSNIAQQLYANQGWQYFSTMSRSTRAGWDLISLEVERRLREIEASLPKPTTIESTNVQR